MINTLFDFRIVDEWDWDRKILVAVRYEWESEHYELKPRSIAGVKKFILTCDGWEETPLEANMEYDIRKRIPSISGLLAYDQQASLDRMNEFEAHLRKYIAHAV